VLLVPKAVFLRQQADLCRRIASIPTEGGRREDRVLLTVADDLERQAAALEERSPPAANRRGGTGN
jgi:hypothetical protein